MFVAVEPTSVTRAVWVINVTCGGTAIYLRQIVFSIVGIAVSSIIGHIPGRQCATKCATLVSTSAIESLRRSGRVVECGGLENR